MPRGGKKKKNTANNAKSKKNQIIKYPKQSKKKRL